MRYFERGAGYYPKFVNQAYEALMWVTKSKHKATGVLAKARKRKALLRDGDTSAKARQSRFMKARLADLKAIDMISNYSNSRTI